MKDYNKYKGWQFSRLKVVDFVKNDKPKFVCLCDCGQVVEKVVYDVLRCLTQSCGCLQSEKAKENGHKNLKPGVLIGDKFVNKKGREYEVVEYVRSHKVKVRFTESGYEKWTATKEIKRCCVVDDSMADSDRKSAPEKLRKEKKVVISIGDVFTNRVGETYEVIGVSKSKTCRIKFKDWFGYEKEVRINDAKRGVWNPYRRCYAGVGYNAVGDFSNKTHPRIHRLWSNMIQRCYREDLRHKNPTYADCIVVDDWHNFQVFAKWCTTNPYFQKYPDWHMDKDILIFGNKVYGPDTCCFVPVEINNLFTLRGNDRGDYPLGVSLSKKNDKFVAQINEGGKRKGLGYFTTVEGARNAYIKAKEESIKRAADKYRDELPSSVYEALVNWKASEVD